MAAADFVSQQSSAARIAPMNVALLLLLVILLVSLGALEWPRIGPSVFFGAVALFFLYVSMLSAQEVVTGDRPSSIKIATTSKEVALFRPWDGTPWLTIV